MSEHVSNPSLQVLVQKLMVDDLPAAQLRDAFAQLRRRFENLTALTGYNREEIYKAQVVADQGTAISINQTVRCFHDERRTLFFFRAMVRAIREKQAAHPGRTIAVCYAGCGPYAPFCTLVAPLFKPTEVQFTLLEINGLALERARDLVNRLDLTSYVRSFQHVDAVTHQFAPEERFHVLFSETLDAALHRECFVPILLNLLPQLDPSTILIPQNVILRACLVNRSAFASGLSDIRDPAAHYDEQAIGEVFNVQEALAPYVESAQQPVAFPARTFQVPDIFDFDYLVIYTEVQVYQELWLTRGESLLTEPWVRDVNKVVPGTDLVFTYQLQPQVALQLS